jgi:CheY-like chemotaxis protein
MSKAVRERAFEPFFTTKDAGRGTGLGLSMVYGFARQSGGHVRLDSEEGRGTAIRICLPRWRKAAETEAAPGGTEFRRGGAGECILLVEDNEAVREVNERMLAELGYRVRTAVDVAGALEQLELFDEVRVVFSDVMLGGPRTGADLAREVARRWPRVRILLASGYAPGHPEELAALGDRVAFLGKPFHSAEIAQRLGALLAPPAG